MPAFDPDAEVAGLTLTIPSWVGSIERTRTKANLSIVSVQARDKLMDALISLIDKASEIDLGAVGQRFLYEAAILQQSVPAYDKRIHGSQESLLNRLFGKRRRFAFFAVEFMIALPDDPAVFVGGMPYLCPEKRTAICADQARGEYGIPAVASPQGFPPCHLVLHKVPLFRCNNGRMAVLHIILRNRTIVDLFLFREEVDRVAFLQKRIAFVFFIGEDAFHRAGLPFLFPGRSRNVRFGKVIGNRASGLSADKQSVNLPHDFRFLRDNFRQSIRAASVSEELFVWKADLAVREPLALSPCHIFRNGAAFFLGK